MTHARMQAETQAETQASAATATDPQSDEMPVIGATQASTDSASDRAVPPADGGDPTPSWFVRTYPSQTLEDLARSYRAIQPSGPSAAAPQNDEAFRLYNKRLEERFQAAQRMVDPQFSPAAVPQQHAPAPRAKRAGPQPAAHQSSLQSKRADDRNILGVSMPVAALLTAVACGLGSAGGYVMANPKALSSLGAISAASLSSFAGLFGAGTPEPLPAPNPAKPVKVANVQVTDVAGAVNAPIPLEISALPPDSQTPIELRISGLPRDAYLTAGTQVKAGEWLLKPEDVPSAQLIVQKSASPELGLVVTALDAQTGDAASPSKTMRVALDLNAVPVPGLQPPPEQNGPAKPIVKVTPVAAQPDQGFNTPADLPQAVPPPLENLRAEANSFLEKGDMLLKAGDIIASRQFYMQAHELQSADGTYGVARTYDPKVFAQLNVRGLSPNPVKALEWYGKAAAAGHAAAAQELLAPPQ